MKCVQKLKPDQTEGKVNLPSLYMCLIKTFYGKFLSGSSLKFLQDGKRFFQLI